MHDEEGGDERSRREEAEDAPALAAYDRWIGQALSSAEWIADFAVFAAERENRDIGGQLATAWVRVVRPNCDFLAALHRLDRVRGEDGDWCLLLKSPVMGDSYVMHCWSRTVTNVLADLLSDEADFVSNMLAYGARNANSVVRRKDL
ncbi:hypothetical protein [Sphingobium yanoikuyae]|uniref:hypothetical protein n=1 Tax=Sphingobium yanoikuyae TaxID=13690 RepID=UPI000262B9C4|nr:hypothetical protein [Sphingobium yanoikuyae]